MADSITYRQSLRETLRMRFPHGRPGSKRHQRWMNDQFLRATAGCQGDRLDVAELKELYRVEWRSALSALVELENRSARDLFRACCEPPAPQPLPHKSRKEIPVPDGGCVSAEEMFLRVDRKIRALFKKQQIPLGLVESFEKDLAAHVQAGMTVDEVVLTCENSFHRLLAHGICQYYALPSVSEDSSDGRRIVRVKRPNTPVVMPPQTLATYLAAIG